VWNKVAGPYTNHQEIFFSWIPELCIRPDSSFTEGQLPEGNAALFPSAVNLNDLHVRSLSS
jgi:hypothetical protein